MGCRETLDKNLQVQKIESCQMECQFVFKFCVIYMKKGIYTFGKSTVDRILFFFVSGVVLLVDLVF